MPNSQLIIRQPSPTPAKVDAQTTSLLEWFVRYGEAEVAGSPDNTVDAKRRDLQLFLTYFNRTLRWDNIGLEGPVPLRSRTGPLAY